MSFRDLRITCSTPGPRNAMGKPKLVVKFVDQGLWAWCASCRRAYFVRKETCMEAWQNGIVLEKGCGHTGNDDLSQ